MAPQTLTNFDPQIFLISINAPVCISVYDWTRFLEELKTKEIIGMDDEAEHSHVLAKQKFSVMFSEYKDYGIDQTFNFDKGAVVPKINTMIPAPMKAVIEHTAGKPIV